MLIRLILGLLAGLPVLTEEIEEAIADLRGSKNGTAKIAAALDTASKITSQLSTEVSRNAE